MTGPAPKVGGILAEITQHLTGIFRHMLPGALVLGGAALAFPDWFSGVDPKSWQHLILLSVLAVVVGNTWFAVNRYGPHQILDYVLWRLAINGPAKNTASLSFVDDLGQYTYKAMHVGEGSARARQHVAFRASTVLLVLTLGELSLVLTLWHSPNSILARHQLELMVIAACALALAAWQMVITRRIDYYVVNPPLSPTTGRSAPVTEPVKHATDVVPAQQGDWSMSQERAFIENLLGQRFSFFLVFFSIVIAGSVNVKTQAQLQIILGIGTAILALLTSVLRRSQQKLDLIITQLKKDQAHPITVIDRQAGARGSRRRIIGVWIPFVCTGVLVIGLVLALLGYLQVPQTAR